MIINIDIDPVMFRWGQITVGWHGFWILTAVASAYLVVVYEGQRRKIAYRYWSDLLVWVAVFGYISARLVHILDHWEVYAQQPRSLLTVNGAGSGLFGALIGGTFATLIYARIKKLPFWTL